jgi:hypothetical protein
MRDDKYVEGLEKQNEELMARLAEHEVLVKKLGRKRGTYPVMKLIKLKRGRTWYINESFLTNCDSIDEIMVVIKYNIKRPILTDRDGADGTLVGFKYWRQPFNYRWSICGMARYIDMQMRIFDLIRVDPKSGFVDTVKY